MSYFGFEMSAGFLRKFFIMKTLYYSNGRFELIKGLLFSRGGLALIKRRAIHRGIWFKVLDKVKRIIIDLTIKCVERVRGPRLMRIVATIVDKLVNGVKGQLRILMKEDGLLLAQKLSRIAQNWGNEFAVQWVKDSGFLQYLVLTHVSSLKNTKRNTASSYAVTQVMREQSTSSIHLVKGT